MELVAIILVIAAVVAAEVLIFGKYALKGIYYSASVNKAEVYEGETLELTEVVENRRFVALPWIKTGFLKTLSITNSRSVAKKLVKKVNRKTCWIKLLKVA